MSDSHPPLTPPTPQRFAKLPLVGPGSILLVILVLAAVFGTTNTIRWSNQLIRLETGVDTQWKQVENQLVRQHDLIPRLVKIVEQSAAFEERVLVELAEARSSYLSAAPLERPERAAALDEVLGRTFAVMESYPDLKTNRQLRDLAYEVAGTQNRIALERQRYNELVGAYNARLRQLPWKLLAEAGAESRSYFAAPEQKLADPSFELSL